MGRHLTIEDMSLKNGNCYDSARAKRYWSRFKTEALEHREQLMLITSL
jgi:hypothetical protein